MVVNSIYNNMVYNDTVMDTIFQPNISRVKEATLVIDVSMLFKQ